VAPLAGLETVFRDCWSDNSPSASSRGVRRPVRCWLRIGPGGEIQPRHIGQLNEPRDHHRLGAGFRRSRRRLARHSVHQNATYPANLESSTVPSRRRSPSRPLGPWCHRVLLVRSGDPRRPVVEGVLPPWLLLQRRRDGVRRPTAQISCRSASCSARRSSTAIRRLVPKATRPASA